MIMRTFHPMLRWCVERLYGISLVLHSINSFSEFCPNFPKIDFDGYLATEVEIKM